MDPMLALEATRERGWALDINAAFGGGWSWEASSGAALARARVGLQRMDEPMYWTLGPTVAWRSWAPPALGLQGESLHLSSGVQVQLGGEVDTEGVWGAHAALGITLLAVEGGLRFVEGNPEAVVLGKLRIPVTWIWKSMSR